MRVEAGDNSVDGAAGTLFHFDPEERHSVGSDRGARLPRRPDGPVRRQRLLADRFCPCCSARRCQRLYENPSIQYVKGMKMAA